MVRWGVFGRETVRRRLMAWAAAGTRCVTSLGWASPCFMHGWCWLPCKCSSLLTMFGSNHTCRHPHVPSTAAWHRLRGLCCHRTVEWCFQVYEVIKEEINSGGRAYIVCPLVNESDAYEDVRTVQDEFARLSSSGRMLLHGTTVPAASAPTVL